MPFEPSKLEGEAPKEPHLAVFMEDGWVALPKGARFLIVRDPKRVDRIIPVFLAKVDQKQLVFRCNCGQHNCTRVLRYQLKAEGHHPTQYAKE